MNTSVIPILRLFLFVYLLIVGWLLFKSTGSTDRESYFQTEVKKREIHLVPFANTITSLKGVFSEDFVHPEKQYYQRNVLYNILGNLFLFSPLGFLTPLVYSKIQSSIKVIIAAFVISFSAEVTQYLLKIGVFDIDDIIFNVAGAILGFFVLKLVKLKRA